MHKHLSLLIYYLVNPGGLTLPVPGEPNPGGLVPAGGPKEGGLMPAGGPKDGGAGRGGLMPPGGHGRGLIGGYGLYAGLSSQSQNGSRFLVSQ
ncbi:MAG: hypothetical protein IKJ49_04230 [Bacteroidaceae bacterium]|nr:hypothetical protein [Bacteroidaceae bacterium]